MTEDRGGGEIRVLVAEAPSVRRFFNTIRQESPSLAISERIASSEAEDGRRI